MRLKVIGTLLVEGTADDFRKQFPQVTYGRVLDFDHEYAVPVDAAGKFKWQLGYRFLPPISIDARHYYTVAGHNLILQL